MGVILNCGIQYIMALREETIKIQNTALDFFDLIMTFIGVEYI
jgi:hypothetical protein